MELGNFDAGTLSITFDNNDGYFTPRATPLAGQPTLKTRRVVYVTATYSGTTYTIATGIVERWPASVDNGDLTVTVPSSDAFKLFTETQLPDSDSGFIAKSKPRHYFPMQESDNAQGTADVVGKKKLRVTWASPFTLADAQFWANANNAPLPTIEYGAGSILPSGNGASINLGSYYSNGGVHGAWGFVTDSNFAVSTSAGFSFTLTFMLPTLTHPDGSNASLLSVFDGSANEWVNYAFVTPTGTLGIFDVGVGKSFITAFPNAIAANTFYRLTVSAVAVGPNWTVTANLNGSEFTTTTGFPRILASAAVPYYLGGHTMSAGEGAGGRMAYFALWDRALSATEMRSMWGDYLVGPNMTADTRIGRVLDVIGWPTALRDLQAGKSLLNRAPFNENTSVLTLLQDWAGADGGLVYMGDDGKVVFRNRHDRLINSITPTWTFDCAASTGVEEGLEWVLSDDDITNVVNLEYADGSKVQIRNDASIAEYGEKPTDLSPDVVSNDEARDAADWFLFQYAQPRIRVSTVTIYPTAGDDATLWSAAVGAEVGQVIRLANLPANAPASQLDYIIESISHDITRNGGALDWRTSFDVSPLPSPAWLLGGTTTPNLTPATQWSGETGTSLIIAGPRATYASVPDANAITGTAVGRYTLNAAWSAGAVYVYPSAFSIAAGEPLSAGVWVRPSLPTANFKLQFQYRDASNAVISSVDGPIVTATAGQFTQVTHSNAAAPAGTVSVFVFFFLMTTAALGDYFDVDAHVVTKTTSYVGYDALSVLNGTARLAY
jgi:hypothetical protein